MLRFLLIKYRAKRKNFRNYAILDSKVARGNTTTLGFSKAECGQVPPRKSQRGISLMVEHQFSKLRAGVRFSYPAPQSETRYETPRAVNPNAIV
jgi:hypothetical protein